jgi:predicted site-specific integrase-resolvase
MARDGRIRKFVNPRGRTEWNDQDVYTLAGMDPAAQMNVVYARTEPIPGGTTESAEKRLETQKQRVLAMCEARKIPVDMVIGEVRKVNRLHDGRGPAVGFNALMGLLQEKRVKTLIIESRDRISVGASWEMMEWFMKSMCGCEVLVLNKYHVTTESREESKLWIADMLQVHKVMIGEMRDAKIVKQFLGGPDVKTIDSVTKKLDKRLREAKRAERDLGKPGIKKKIVDLDEVF